MRLSQVWEHASSRKHAYASRSLTSVKKTYCQIEKELLAVVFGCERFNHYVYGGPVEVDSDHKPLVPITKKPLVKSPARLQRLLLRLQKYDISTTYVPGKYMHVADTLSTATLNEKSAHSELNASHKTFRNKALICSFRNPQGK